jgi:hypothetical protein
MKVPLERGHVLSVDHERIPDRSDHAVGIAELGSEGLRIGKIDTAALRGTGTSKRPN